jgi:hypothetical protein
MNKYGRMFIKKVFEAVSDEPRHTWNNAENSEMVDVIFNSPGGNKFETFCALHSNAFAYIFDDIIKKHHSECLDHLGSELPGGKIPAGGILVKTCADKIIFSIAYWDKDWHEKKIDGCRGRIFMTFDKNFNYISSQNKPNWRKHSSGNTWEQENGAI